MAHSASHMGTGNRLAAACRITRPITCLLAALSAACGGSLAGHPAAAGWGRDALSMVSMAGVMGVANAVNDIADLPADRIGKPWRPIASGQLGVRTAWSVVLALALLTMTTAAALGPTQTLFAGALLLLDLAYSYRLKDTVLVGNLVVGVVCGGTLLFGASVTGGLTLRPCVAAGTVLLFVLGYEIVKTLQDSAADGEAGFRTLATVFRPEVSVGAYATVAAALCLAVLAVGAPVSSAPSLFLVCAAPFLIAPVCLCAWILWTSPDRDASTARVLLILRLAWFPGLFSLALLK
ncbi:geranylgeranylglycerol-phosphate geranylgeranyltransferase [Streptomyces sp. 2231.1]|uniref:UbiA family prenyltransferase n=1 Tax=Streptomyces sp. 2231.1 TaxID=1855347 RepID=UPI000895B731|nr:UbiA family prenyltransferase [Streptomyces sp. 2231.1]SEE31615.1 geranylgeranylglycerol-phosphate geranylgeranyltransferase [Streptomyces sp. 2231.1]